MATLDTTDDLLRAARENPEFREAFRREILTEELLALPERFAAYATTTDKRLAGIGETREFSKVSAWRRDSRTRGWRRLRAPSL